MKKIIPIIIIITLIIVGSFVFILTRHTHTFSDATCTTAKVCECDDIQGETLGHTWVEATCTSAMTCSVCQTTEGLPIGHRWIEADYENPKTCELCGLKNGEPLEAVLIPEKSVIPDEPITSNEPTTEIISPPDGTPYTLTDGDRYALRTLGATEDEINSINTIEEFNKILDQLAYKFLASNVGNNSDTPDTDKNTPTTPEDNNATTNYDPNAYYPTEYYIDLYVPDELKGTLTVTSRDDTYNIIYLEGGGRKYALSIPTSPDWDPNDPLNPPLLHDITDLPAGYM